MNIVIGRNAVIETLKHSPERIEEILYARGVDKKGAEDIFSLIHQSSVPARAVDRDKLAELSGSSSHQGFVANLQPRDYQELKVFLKERKDQEQSLVVLVDSISDPQNFGTILRAAECLGADSVIFSKNRGCDVTPTVTKASVGASELMPLIRVSNLADALGKCKKAGYWAVAAAVGEGAEDLAEFDFPRKAIVMLGAEGGGLQPLLVQSADFKVAIPMFGSIDSLNVSQATAVLLSQYAMKHLTKSGV